MSHAVGGDLAMGAVFNEFIAGLNEDFDLHVVARPNAVRDRLQRAIASTDFRAQCARMLLEQHVWASQVRQFFVDPRQRYSLQIFCWPPGFGNDPHCHETWTVAGVMAGSLLVFRSATSAADCRASAPILARTGEAGVLIPPQFHCLRNDGDETAITFHLFSLDSAEKRPNLEGRPAAAPRFDDDDVVAIVRMVVERRGVEAADCIHAAFAAVGPTAKLDLVKLMLKLDSGAAIALGRTLSRLVGGPDGGRLLKLVERLEAVAQGNGVPYLHGS
ncbi:MAG: hypothetical protein JWQ55_363 [Rhodopila sp.]|nr:hypothetical protein [Rhodopila sp.]